MSSAKLSVQIKLSELYNFTVSKPQLETFGLYKTAESGTRSRRGLAAYINQWRNRHRLCDENGVISKMRQDRKGTGTSRGRKLERLKDAMYSV